MRHMFFAFINQAGWSNTNKTNGSGLSALFKYNKGVLIQKPDFQTHKAVELKRKHGAYFTNFACSSKPLPLARMTYIPAGR